MKKILMLTAMVAFTVSSWAGDFKVDISKTNPWGESKFDASTSTISLTQAWQGCGWWLAKDCSEYEKVVIKFAKPLPVAATFMVIYKEKDEKGENIKQKMSVPAGSKEASITLDEKMKSAVNGLGLSGKAAGDIVFKSITIKE